MTEEREEREKNKPRREKARVSESRKLIEQRKISSNMLFMLERDLSLDGNLTEPRICAPKLLSVKVKRQISSKKSFVLSIKSNYADFPAHKGKEISIIRLSSIRRIVERREHRTAHI